MKKIKKVLSILVDVLIGILFVITLFIVISSVNQKKTGVANVFGYTSNVVVTDSMEDTINVGDVIISKILDKDYELKEGDIVSFYQMVNNEKTLIAHRIVEIEKGENYNYYVTRGDNYEVCPENDSIKKIRGDIQSTYCFRIRGLGKVINFLKTPGGFIGFIIVPIVLFIAFLVYRLIKIYVTCKNEEMIEKQKESTSDDVKDAIIKEYLAKQELENKENEKNKKE